MVGNKINYVIIDSPIGKLLLAGDASGLQKIQFENNIKIDKNWQKDNNCFKQVLQQLEEYFGGNRIEFSLKLNPQGTEFQKLVWQKLQQIKFGATKFYSEIAKEIGNPKAARAIGMANNKNPIPIIIPCHRVIGKNGSLTGFAGGINIKQQLLNLESV